MAAVFPDLVLKLGELASALREADLFHWAKWMERARDELAAGNPIGVERVISAYGGMGSFNDLPLAWEDPVMALGAEVYGQAAAARQQLQIQARGS